MAENVYTVSLSGAYEENRRERTIKAVEILRRFLARHSKVEEENVKISNDLNSVVWEYGMERPPRSVKVVTTKDEKGNILADLFKEPKTDEKKDTKPKKKVKGEVKAEVKKEEIKKEEKIEVKKEVKVEQKKEVKAEVKKETRKVEKKEVKEKKKPAKGRGTE
ncbi:50S ribosomal protein L31e [Candidatus Micrarchaeota archaeon]|nr:50S ribosomal protein L31e [Candidatus Micrarchaeota archaeon]